ncbi:hypothetical protein ACHWQZ_G015205 [Mnemiopsis leidyi]
MIVNSVLTFIGSPSKKLFRIVLREDNALEEVDVSVWENLLPSGLQINSEMHEQGYENPPTDYESDSTMSDADYRLEEDSQNKTNLGLHDMSLDPRQPVSDHESDGELSTVGFNDHDTDDEEAAPRDTETLSRLEQNPKEWCFAVTAPSWSQS